MATKDIEEYFGDRKPIKIEWINDTSCNAVFDSAEQAKEAIQDLLLEPTSDINHTLLRKAKVYTMESGRTVNNLHLRLASEWDVKERGARERSRYYLLHGVNKDINSRLGKRRIEKKKPNDILSRLGGYQEPGRRRRH
ncbi:hypothetical protein K450DRAFT_247576 [Umbelopsis ramanniana AG]|uniref:Uncharacterized protein n=1 Tax=Umbelopsis ramanniana AG TaxID=1314678 RepID=A0AAD5HDP7_UMBRA|nr:uncharacterized protein K450DRAFT_247576 [Umbelopsis ramanniana AG]KAI8578373.1 hypothetical protein K450DRAFT_247576 [Umbelopsis ramanniana AG]